MAQREPTASLWIANGQGGYWLKFNYTDLAERCDIQSSTVSRYFSPDAKQRRSPSMGVLKCLAKQLGVTLDQLVGALESGAVGL